MHTTDYKAFVSATAKDLLPHRAHVIQELRRAGFHVDPMEDWPASAGEPKQFSRERLDGCHLCVLLIARRRGYVPQGEEQSITQLEYREALRLKIDVLPYFLDDAETDWPAEFDVIAKAKTDAALAGERDKLLGGGPSGSRGFSPIGNLVPHQHFKRGQHTSYDPDDFDDIVAVINETFNYNDLGGERRGAARLTGQTERPVAQRDQSFAKGTGEIEGRVTGVQDSSRLKAVRAQRAATWMANLPLGRGVGTVQSLWDPTPAARMAFLTRELATEAWGPHPQERKLHSHRRVLLSGLS